MKFFLWKRVTSFCSRFMCSSNFISVKMHLYLLLGWISFISRHVSQINITSFKMLDLSTWSKSFSNVRHDVNSIMFQAIFLQWLAYRVMNLLIEAGRLMSTSGPVIKKKSFPGGLTLEEKSCKQSRWRKFLHLFFSHKLEFHRVTYLDHCVLAFSLYLCSSGIHTRVFTFCCLRLVAVNSTCRCDNWQNHGESRRIVLTFMIDELRTD